MNPKISIITITYNRARFLPEAIESVLAQSFTDWELLIIDDASTDDTSEVAGRYASIDQRIKYYKNQENLKISRSRNRGLELSKGDYVAVLDSDDIWRDKDKLQKQYDYLVGHPACGLIGGGVVVIDERGKEMRRYLNEQGDESIRKKLLIKNQFAQSSVMYPRQAVLDLGKYDVELSGIEDYDLWMRVGAKYELANLDSYVLSYRLHGGNVSVTDRARLMERNLFLIKKYKEFYPSYRRAWLRRILRLWAYRFLSMIIK